MRYEPKSNSCEIDRFTWELIDDDVCFLYGDVYYTEQAIRRIVEMPVKALGFARNDTGGTCREGGRRRLPKGLHPEAEGEGSRMPWLAAV